MIPPDELELIVGPNVPSEIAEQWERGAVAFVERQTGRYFGEPDELTEYLIGDGTRNLWIRDRVVPVDTDSGEEYAVASVRARTNPGGDPTELEQGTDYLVRPLDRETPLVRTGGNVWTRGTEYEVLYLRGYVLGTEPADIRQLVIDLIKIRATLWGKEGLSGESIGGYSYTRPAIHAFEDGDLRSIVGAMATIKAWRRPVMA
jgi:hypothetical protein